MGGPKGVSKSGIGVSPVVATVVVLAVIAVAVVAWTLMAGSGASRLTAPAGPPCPAAAPASAQDAASATALQWSQVGDVSFGRTSGGVSCDAAGSPMRETTSGGDVALCQFSAPIKLTVKTRRGQFDYQVPAGHVASVFVSHGLARCILAAPYWTAASRALSKDIHAPPS